MNPEIQIQTKYITPDDFLNYFGIDLGKRLKGDANPSDKANMFLNRIEVRMEAFLNANTGKLVTDCWPRFSDYQKLHYKYALLEQAMYVFKNGDISVDSGYDPDEGVKISSKDKKAIILAPNAMDHLVLIGLWTRHIASPSFFSIGGFFVDGGNR